MTKVQKERDDERGNLSDRGMIFPSDERKEDKGCITEAFLLMKAAMDSSPENWFDESTFMSYGECVLATIFSLQDLNELSSEDASNILSLFEWKEFGSALLQNSELYTVLVKEQRVGRKESETKGNVAFLLSLYAALLSIEGGLNCANDIGELLLQPSSSGKEFFLLFKFGSIETSRVCMPEKSARKPFILARYFWQKDLVSKID